LVPWVYGSNYANVPDLLFGLLAAYILNSSCSITSLVIWARGRAHINATATGLGVSIALLTGYLLVPAYGIWGMIYGKIIGSSIIFLLITIFAMREISLIKSP
jgi:O-antigen/teichoic acid export membrane protein